MFTQVRGKMRQKARQAEEIEVVIGFPVQNCDTDYRIDLATLS
jgi:hypothetical protein